MPSEDSQRQQSIAYASAAYQAAMHSKWELVVSTLERLSAELGSRGLVTAMISWCDTYIHHCTGGAQPATARCLSYFNAETGALNAPDDEAALPPALRWAGKVLMARADMDEQRWCALMDELPDDPGECGRHVLALLDAVVTTVSMTPEGFAVLGREHR